MTISPLSDKVYLQLRDLLEQPDMQPGRRLPSEQALATSYAVSRPVLRQALARLRTEGYVVARRGAGNFAAKPPVPNYGFGPLQNVPDLRSFLEFRCLIEGESAAAAARCNAPRLRAEITRWRRALEAALARGEPGIDEDIRFHVAIAAASGNRFIVMTMAALAEQTRVSIGLIRELSSQPMVRRAIDIRREHGDIDDAIQAGRSDAARQAMLEHLRGGLGRLFGMAGVQENLPASPHSEPTRPGRVTLTASEPSPHR